VPELMNASERKRKTDKEDERGRKIERQRTKKERYRKNK
jgi:hypothetical protein